MKRSYKSFAELKEALKTPDEDLELNIYPSLIFGSFFRIPDADTGFGKGGGYHPWIIIQPHERPKPTVIVCPRTTKMASTNSENSLYMPGGLIEGLDEDGAILLGIRRVLLARDFRRYRYIGVLPEEWTRRLRERIHRWADRAKGKVKGP